MAESRLLVAEDEAREDGAVPRNWASGYLSLRMVTAVVP